MGTTAGASDPDRRGRDVVIDAVRALSLFVVVLWHWVFTTITWRADGPHASNPIGVTRGLWLATWLLQVMPLFFFAGGYVHSLAWATSERRGSHGWGWVARRLRALLLPALTLVAVGVLAWRLAAFLRPDARWVKGGIVLMLSPLWFLVIYAFLVTGMPLWRLMHDKLGEVAVVLLVGIAVVVDVLRFRYHLAGVEWVNLVAVWSVSHQLGFFYERLAAAPKRFAWCLVLGGLFALFGLTNMGLYPRSMVGVPGERLSNMAPPTLCIAALTVLQVGVLLLNRERIARLASRGHGERFVSFASRNAMRVFLWHAPGFAVVYGLWRLAGLPGIRPVVDLSWWLWRPAWLVLPIVPTVILASTLGQLAIRRDRVAGSGPG